MTDVEIIPAAAADVSVLRHLMQLYLYDLATLEGWDIGNDGAFGNAERIERFWSEPARWSFLIKVAGTLAGFALVRKGSDFSGEATEMSEFFVLARYRRRGIGRHAATAVFARFPGTWEVKQLDWNHPAQSFWRSVIARYTANHFEEFRTSHEGQNYVVHRFTVPK